MEIIKGDANTESDIRSNVEEKTAGTITIELVSGGFRSHGPEDHRVKDGNWIAQMKASKNTKQMVIW